MRPEVETINAKALLTPPKTFEREQYMAFLFAAHSPKLARRVVIGIIDFVVAGGLVLAHVVYLVLTPVAAAWLNKAIFH